MKNLFLICLSVIVSIIAAGGAGGANWTLSTDVGSARIMGIGAGDSSHVRAAGNSGEIYLYDGSSWSLETDMEGEHRGAFALDASHFWAAGNTSSNKARVCFYNGSSWSENTLNTAYAYDVYAADATHIWTVCGSGNIYFSSDGVNWSLQTDTGGAYWKSVDGTASNHVWAVGNRQVISFDGTTWHLETEFTTAEVDALRGVAVAGTNDVWVTGATTGMVWHYDGNWSRSTNLGQTQNYGPIAAQGANQIWAGGDLQLQNIFFFDGNLPWTADHYVYPYHIISLDASVSMEVWAGGSSGKIYHLDIPTPSPTPTPIYVTQNWTLSTEITGERLYSVAAGDENNVWLPSSLTSLPNGGKIFHYNGTSWSIQTTAFSVETGMFRGCDAYDSTNVWAVGNSIQSTRGRIYYNGGGDWQLQTHLTTGSTYLYDAFAANSLSAWVVGNAGYIYRTTDGGTNWSLHSKIGSSIWNGIHGIDTNNVWAVGGEDPSRIVYYNGSNWTIQSEVNLGSSKYLRGVAAVTQTDVWAVGDEGVILHYDDSGDWTIAEDVGDTTNNAKISARDADNIWATFAGAEGGVYYYNGAVWAVVQGINLYSAYDVDASVPDRVWATGDSDEAWVLIIPTPTPSTTPTAVPTASTTPTAVPTASMTPSATPSAYIPPPTPTPTAYIPPPTATPTIPLIPTPTATLVNCFNVSGRITQLVSGDPIAGARVRASIGNRESSVAVTNAMGFYNLSPCSHLPDSTVIVKGRRPGYLPNTTSRPYTNWSDLTGVDLELMPANIDRLIASSDYDGDGTPEIAIFRPSTGMWAARGVTRVYYGLSTDELIPADYDGDGTTEAGIFRATSGLWAIRSLTRIYFGDFADIPVPGDFNGDGTSETAVFRGSNGLWAARGVTTIYFGAQDDQPIPGDYDGDGTPDIAVFRSSNQLWALRGVSRVYFGNAPDRLIPADYSGDGTAVPAVFRGATGLWAIRNLSRWYFGSAIDSSLPADLNGDGTADAMIFRNTSGLWAARGFTRVYFGSTGDIPVTR